MILPAIEQDALLRAILDTSVAAVCVLDPAGQIIFANERAKDILGLRPAEVVRRAYDAPEWKATAPDGGPWPDELQPFTRVMKTGEPVFDVRHAIEWPDGRRKLLSVNGAPIKSHDGEITHLVFSMSDITARSEIELRMRENADWLHLALSGAQMGTWSWNVDSDIVRWSADVAPLFGLDEGEFGGTFNDYLSLVHPDDLERVQKSLVSAVASKARTYTLEHRLLRPDGAECWIEGRGRVYLDEKGEPAKVSGTVMDITIHKTAELALRRSEEMLRSVLETVPSYIARVSRNHEVLFLNRPIPHIKMSDVIGRDAVRFMARKSQDAFRQALDRAIETGEPQQVETLAHRPSGDPVSFLLHIGPVKSGDTVQSLTIVGVDITRIKETEQALQDSQLQLRQAQRLESIGRLAGGVAHDFNNMLTAIMGFAEIAHFKLSDRPAEQGFIEKIREAADRGSGLTRQLLTFAREQVVQPSVVDLNTAITEIGKMLPRMIGEDITVATDLTPGLWPVEIDPGQFEQVIINLALNARDAMPEGGRVSITSANCERTAPAALRGSTNQREWVVVTIQDSGTGMDSETLRLIFEPFFTTKEPGKGTGLGLSTCFGVASQAGGTIEVKSVPGKGTEFRIFFPKSSGETVQLEPQLEAMKMHKGTETILLVEDDTMVRDVTREMLSSGGYELLEASGGEEALELFLARDGRVDLLITDVVMPRMSGTELAGELREKNPDLKVLFVSGYAPDVGPLHDAVGEGSDLLQKPFSGDGLTAKVREILDQLRE